MSIFKRTLMYLALAIAAATFIYPFLWMAATTFKPPTELGSLSVLPAHPTLDNYRTMLERAPFGRALLNKTVGDEVEVHTPRGKRTYQIVDLLTLHDRAT